MGIFCIEKPAGATPLAAMQAYQAAHPERAGEAMTYAGRLDPMAEGLLLVLSGEDRFKKDDYLGLDKTYEAAFLFGFTSDTYDALGLPRLGSTPPTDEHLTAPHIGTHTLPLPPYAAYKVHGKPLHTLTRAGTLSTADIPVRDMHVLDVCDVHIEHVPASTILANITARINAVTGDFRQDDILDAWRKVLDGDQTLTILRCTLSVTSGTYIRSLAQELGEKYKCGALLYQLRRTRIGTFTLPPERTVQSIQS